jgi:AcrR family transcriptional regulator
VKEMDPRAKAYHHGDLRRALIDAALKLVSEEQDWTFSLREVARRAGVSHNAPYNHFPEKRDLLAAVAAVGFEALEDRMRKSIAGVSNPRAALLASGKAYVEAGSENPALYRLMFGPALGAALEGASHTPRRPAEVRDAGLKAKSVLEDIVLRGAETGAFAVSPKSRSELAMASLSIWASIHGLTMLIIDEMTASELSIDTLVARLIRRLLEGLEPRSHAGWRRS